MSSIPPGAPASRPVAATRKAASVAGVPLANPKIAGVIGAELAGPVHVIRRVIRIIRDTNRCSPAELAELLQAVEDADAIARHSQQLARLAEGRVRQSHERVSLDLLIESALKERQLTFQERGVTVLSNIKPVEIVVDPGLLLNLVEAALDWAIQQGPRLVVSLDINRWPEYGVLSIQASPSPSTPHTQGTSASTDTLNWHLLAQIAHAMGATLKMQTDGAAATLSLEFVRTVKHLEALSAREIEASTGDSAFHTGTRALAGLRILLISTDATVRGEVEKACHDLGLRADTAADAEQAARTIEREQAQMIIIDERRRDAVFDALLHDIRQRAPNFGFLEVTDDANTFEVSSWMGDSMTRVSRDVLRQHLPAVLTMELAKAF